VTEQENPTVRKSILGFYLFLLFVGIAFWAAWGVLYGAWNPLAREWVGVYSILVVTMGFGIVGYFLYSR